MNRISMLWLAMVLLGAAFVLPDGVAAQTTEAQTTEAQTTEAQTTEAQTTEAQTTEAQTTEAQSAPVRPRGAKSRMTILNLIPEASPMDIETGLPKGLPGEFRKSSEFEITDLNFTGKMVAEWARGGPVAQQSRAEKLGRFYEVPFMVSGRVHAINSRRWVVSFVKLNVPRGRGRQKSVDSRSEFYTILDERDPALRLVLLEHSSAFGFRKSLEGSIRKKRVCEDAMSGEDAKSLFVDRTLVLVEEFYVKFRSDGVWEVSSNPQNLKERGKWWMEGKRLCDTVPRVAKAPCRCIKKDDKGEYNFVWEGGSEQHFRFQ